MILESTHFAEFFAEAHEEAHDDERRRPYRWQQRLLDHVLVQGRWPEQIVAPTGAGKTAVIDVHVFAVAVAAHREDVRVPRRLALLVDRRALTDSQYDYAHDLAKRLAAAPAGSILAQVADVLRGLRWPGPGNDAVPEPLMVSKVRGGAPPARAWRDDPAACAVLCCTPAMWGSRVLMRGYGATPAARPREAGLLTMDAVVVVDEAHLSRQLLTTARRIAELAEHAETPAGVPVLQVVETTATAGTAQAEWTSVGVEKDDLDSGNDPELTARVCADKQLRFVTMPHWPILRKGRGKKAAIQQMADLAIALREEFGPMVCCYVNTVATARDLYQEITTRTTQRYVVELFCGRMRPYDAGNVTERLAPGNDGLPPFDLVVSTQSLEVGVDCEFSAALSELAPASALAQRAGRVHRSGKRGAAAMTVVGPETALEVDVLPYRADDLNTAREWLGQLTDIRAWTVACCPPPPASPRRKLLQRPELMDIDFLARTNDELASDHEVSLWLDEDLDTDHDLGIVVRTGMPADHDDAVRLVQATPVQDHEVFPARVGTARKAIDGLLATASGQSTAPQVIRIRRGAVTVVDAAAEIGPGDLVVVDETAPLFQAGIVTAEPDATTACDVLEARQDPPVGQVTLRLGDGSRIPRDTVQPVLDELHELSDSFTSRNARDRIADLLNTLAEDFAETCPSLPHAVALLRGRIRDCEITLHLDEDEKPQRLILLDTRRAARDEEIRQTWTPHDSAVMLEAHNADVAARARALATNLGLPHPLPDVLHEAGKYHDGGKRDYRFQRFLGAASEESPDTEPIAKSTARSAAQRRADRLASGLPRGWRHEQLSTLYFLASGADSTREHELVARLIGTSHGRGRQQFPHTASRLLPSAHPDATLAEAWFDDGGWDDLINTTHRRWGYWGCAYLEALLRAADSQVSMEGQ